MTARMAWRHAAAAFSCAGQARHPPLPGRRALAPRALRPQAEARRDARRSPCPSRSPRASRSRSSRDQQLHCFGPQHAFQRWGQSGQEISTLLPQIGSIADEICIVRSMQTEQINHDPAHTFMNTGTQISGRPSAGSWIWYGIGAEAEDLPGFVVLTSQGRGGQMQPIAARQWHSGFLPSRFQGVHFRSKGDAVLYLRDPDGRHPQPAARRDRRRGSAHPDTARLGGRSRGRGPPQPVRDGVQDADESCPR